MSYDEGPLDSEMQSYELRFLASDNHVTGTEFIESTDDASAYTAVRQQVNGQAIEVWRGSQFIATIESGTAKLPADVSDKLRQQVGDILKPPSGGGIPDRLSAHLSSAML
jgi:hypothetical protein